MTKYFSYTFDSHEYSGFTTSGHIEGDFENELEVERFLMDRFGDEYIDYLDGWSEEGEDLGDSYFLSIAEISKTVYEAEFDYFNFEFDGKKGYFQI